MKKSCLVDCSTVDDFVELMTVGTIEVVSSISAVVVESKEDEIARRVYSPSHLFDPLDPRRTLLFGFV